MLGIYRPPSANLNEAIDILEEQLDRVLTANKPLIRPFIRLLATQRLFTTVDGTEQDQLPMDPSLVNPPSAGTSANSWETSAPTGPPAA